MESLSRIGWEVIEKCQNCGGNVKYYGQVQTAPYLSVDFCGGDLPVCTITSYIMCDDCFLIMQSPRMTPERISEYYSSGLYRQTLGISVSSMDADEKRRSEGVARWLADKNVRPQSHLDIGCSRGYLLALVGAMSKHGFDENPGYSETIRATSDKKSLGKYELVTAIHVLEHALNPKDEIEWYVSLCSDKLLVEIPGEKSKGGPLRFSHLSFMSPYLLSEMVENAGMDVVCVESNPHTRLLAQVRK